MNVNVPTIAAAQPSPSAADPQTTPAEDALSSFASAMQAVQQTSAKQPDDSKQPIVSAAAAGQPVSSAAAKGKSADMPTSASMAVPSLVTAKTLHVTQASLTGNVEDAMPKAEDGSGDGTCVPEDLTGTQQVPRPVDASSQPANAASALQGDTDASQQGVDVCTDVAADASPLQADIGKQAKPDVPSAGAVTTLKKTPHGQSAKAQASAAVEPVRSSSSPVSWLAVAVAAPQQNVSDSAQHDAACTAAAVPGPGPGAGKSLSLQMTVAAKGATSASGTGETVPVLRSADVAPAAGQDANMRSLAAVTTSTAQFADAQISASEHAVAPSAQDVFSGAFASAATALQPAAVFAPSLVDPAPPSHQHLGANDSLGASIGSVSNNTPDGAAVQASSARRLEVSVQDPLLGNLDVRAEMRGGVLHASLTGSQDSAGANLPALHQFLQQHDVTVHTLTYTNAGDGVAAAGSTTFKGDMSRDTGSTASFSGGANTGSQQSSGDSAQSRQQYGASGASYESSTEPSYKPQLPGILTAAMANDTLPTGSTLSIHI